MLCLRFQLHLSGYFEDIQFAVTWNIAEVLSVSVPDAEQFIRDAAKDNVDFFINDYLAAHAEEDEDG